MMSVSQKCQYALRAVFELAKRYGQGPVSVTQVAAAQAIPPRFLELILGQLRQGGFIESRRGVQGGYLLAIPPGQLSAGDIIRFVDGPIGPVRCVNPDEATDCPLDGRCAFKAMWERARAVVEEVFDATTITDLLEAEPQPVGEYVGNYCI